MHSTLTGKMALVTGASRGIGRATAQALAKAGANVIVHYGRSSTEAEALASELRALGGRADIAQADLSQPDGAAELAAQVRTLVDKQLDVLVSNAGVSKAGAIEDHTTQDFDTLFATNVRSSFFLVKELLPLFAEGSSIVFLSSLAAHAVPGDPGQPGAPSLPAYAATKGAIDTLVRHFAAILGPRGIRVNAVAPGVIETDMSNFTKTEAGRAFALSMQSLKRIGQASDVADVIAFLASDSALDHRSQYPCRWGLEAMTATRSKLYR